MDDDDDGNFCLRGRLSLLPYIMPLSYPQLQDTICV